MGHLHREPGRQTSLRWRQVAAAAGTSLLFVVVYSTTNYLASLRGQLGAACLPGEPGIVPFVPLLIVPYMSIDLFFVGAPFLCRDRVELRTFATRIAVSILIAGAFFLFMPLTFAGPRPVPDDWTAPIFRFLHGFDQPHNLFPSLHIALRTLLAATYTRHTRGPLRAILHFWFFLIGLSTLLTWQHHLLDVYGGFLLALLVIVLYREQATPTDRNTNPRIGLYYAAGALIAIAATVACYPAGLFLLWPVTALGLVAAGYFHLGPRIYAKHHGQLPVPVRILLAPILLGHQLSLRHYQRQCRPWDDVLPGLRIGRVLTAAEADDAIARGVCAVLDLTSEFSETTAFRRLEYLNLPILDLTAPTPGQLDRAVAFIAEHRAYGTVYVHCKIGYSRTVAVTAAYLLRHGHAATVDDAIALIRAARPTIVVRPEVRRALDAYAAALRLASAP